MVVAEGRAPPRRSTHWGRSCPRRAWPRRFLLVGDSKLVSYANLRDPSSWPPRPAIASAVLLLGLSLGQPANPPGG
jgi:hypothetical protein